MPKIYRVTVHNEGKTHTLEIPEDRKILNAANERGINLPSACQAGVCTTCAAQRIGEGSVDQSEGMGLSPTLQNEGYVLLCVAYPRSDLEVEAGKEDEVYDLQFGRP